MNRNILKTAFVLFAFTGATTLKAQVAVGVNAGVNFSNVTVKDADNYNLKGGKMIPGAKVGLTFDIPVIRDFYVQPGVSFSMKGTKATGEMNDYFWQPTAGNEALAGDYINISAYYIDVPVNFLFKPAAGPGRLLLGAGPYFAVGVGGRYKDHYNGSTNETGSLKFVKDWNDYSAGSKELAYGKPFDMGLNALFGYEFYNRFSVQLNGQVGLLNIAPNDNGSKPLEKMTNNTFGISVGYKF